VLKRRLRNAGGAAAKVARDGAGQPAPEGGRLQHIAEGAGDTGSG